MEKQFKPYRELTGHGTGPSEPHAVWSEAALVWPAGLPSDEESVLRRLSRDALDELARRLKALRKLRDGEASVGDAVLQAGMSRSAFHAMRRRWIERPTLGSIVTVEGHGGAAARYDTDAVRAAVEGDAGADGVMVAVARAVAASPSSSNGALARDLIAEGVVDAALSTTAKLVRDVRRWQRWQPDALRSAYGARVLIDASAVAIEVEAPEGRVPVVAVFVLEEASGLILATSAGTVEDCLTRQLRALRDARMFLAVHRADRAGAPASRIRFAAGPTDDGARLARLEEFATMSLPVDDLRLTGPRRLGGALTSALGSKVGGMRLVPRATMAGEPLGRPSGTIMPLLSLADADREVDRHVAKHNERIFGVLKAAGSIGDVARGAMAEALERLEHRLPHA